MRVCTGWDPEEKSIQRFPSSALFDYPHLQKDNTQNAIEAVYSAAGGAKLALHTVFCWTERTLQSTNPSMPRRRKHRTVSAVQAQRSLRQERTTNEVSNMISLAGCCKFSPTPPLPRRYLLLPNDTAANKGAWSDRPIANHPQRAHQTGPPSARKLHRRTQVSAHTTKTGGRTTSISPTASSGGVTLRCRCRSRCRNRRRRYSRCRHRCSSRENQTSGRRSVPWAT